MTYHERQEITAKLIGLGFWETGEAGDPTIDYHDAKTLHDRMGARIIGNASLISAITRGYSSARQVLILHGELIYTLVTADSYPESICLAALALPRFLKEHPECSSDQGRDGKSKAQNVEESRKQ
jgi:hypothetical protein